LHANIFFIVSEEIEDDLEDILMLNNFPVYQAVESGFVMFFIELVELILKLNLLDLSVPLMWVYCL